MASWAGGAGSSPRRRLPYAAASFPWSSSSNSWWRCSRRKTKSFLFFAQRLRMNSSTFETLICGDQRSDMGASSTHVRSRFSCDVDLLTPYGISSLDVAVANANSTNVSVLLGNGDGTFQARRNFAAGNGPLSVAVGDFNGDGRPDLAVAHYSSGNVSVLLGNGDGTFQALRFFAAGYTARSVAVGDFNPYGRTDLVVANFGSDNVSVLINNTSVGDVSFQQPRSFVAGGSPFSVAVGDFNGDGVPDLAAANYRAAGTVAVLLGNGDGSFQAPRIFAAGSYPFSVAVGDFNGDGWPDLVVANSVSTDVSVLLGNGDGSFQAARTFGVGDTPVSVAVSDFNGDGLLDLAVANINSNDVSVLLGNGGGTFQGARNVQTGNLASS